MEIRLSDHFTYKKLLRFSFPSMMMLLFTSIYGIVDGFFISNYVGKTSFAAVNLIVPYTMILGVGGFVFGTGGSALIGKTLGAGMRDKANSLFSMVVYATAIVGVIAAVLGIAFLKETALFLGADEAMLGDCITYGWILLFGTPTAMIQFGFQILYVTAEKPKLGFYTTLAAGISNMVFDWLFVALFPFGVAGAAWASVGSQVVGSVIPLVYFAGKNNSLLKLGRAVFDGKALLKVCTNGSSEFVNGISMSIVSMLYNMQLMKYIGEDGVAAYGVLMYVCFIFVSLYIGYSVGVAPVVSFHFGACNKDELKNLRRKSLVIIGIMSLTMFAACELFAKPFSWIYVGYDEGLMALTLHGFRICAFAFLFTAIPIFGSSFFTALNDGFVSASISFLRTMLFQVAAVLLLPLVFGVDGIWISVVAAEIAAALTAFGFLAGNRKKYGY